MYAFVGKILKTKKKIFTYSLKCNVYFILLSFLVILENVRRLPTIETNENMKMQNLDHIMRARKSSINIASIFADHYSNM